MNNASWLREALSTIYLRRYDYLTGNSVTLNDCITAGRSICVSYSVKTSLFKIPLRQAAASFIIYLELMKVTYCYIYYLCMTYNLNA